MTLPNAAQFLQLKPTDRAPQRGDLFVAEDGYVHTITKSFTRKDRETGEGFTVVYEHAGWPIKTVVRQEADYRYREIPASAQLNMRK
jgi:hypothetical protein